MKWRQNVLLLIAVALLTALPLMIVERPAPGPAGGEAELFTGTDDKAAQVVNEVDPGYRRWMEPLWPPASREVESLLFALQAAAGAGFVGYYIGSAVTRARLMRDKRGD